MKVSSRVKSGWEHRFPGLTGKWTHWKITGDGVLLGIVAGERLTAALDLIEKTMDGSPPSRHLVQPWIIIPN